MLAALIGVASPAQVSGERRQSTHAIVSHIGSHWTIEYRLGEKARAWVFPVSAPALASHEPWRQHQWHVLTPGVTIAREGAYDVLRASGGRNLPPTVRIDFTPTNMTLDREYDPAVLFSNGAVALYSDQFDLVPDHSPDPLTSRPSGQSVEELGGTHLKVRFHDSAGPVFVRGERLAYPVLAGAATYVVFGAAHVEEGADVAILADPALPAWLKTELLAFTPQVAARYTARLGGRLETGRPLLLMGWRGPTPGKVINDGGVRPGEILLNFEGEGLVDRNVGAARRAHWFIAHEMAHFWLGSSGVKYRSPADAWITEGGAEMMAFTLLAASDHDYALAELQRAVDDCVRFAVKPIAGAGDRHESRAFYACGTVFALAGSSAIRKTGGRDYFDFIRPLLDTHRADRLLDQSDWLTRFNAVAGDAATGDIMREMLETGVSDPAAQIASLFERTGVGYSKSGGAVLLAPSAI
jgi:hypothetical protein